MTTQLNRIDAARKQADAKHLLARIDHEARIFGQNYATERRGDDSAAMFAAELVKETSMQMIERKYPELRWGDGSIVPFKRGGDPGVQVLAWYEKDIRGEADFINDLGDGAGVVGMNLTEHTARFKKFGIKMVVTDADVDRAKTQGLFNVAKELSAAAKRGYLQKLHRLVLNGDASRGFNGIRAIPESYVPPITGIGGVGTWSTASPMEIVNDLSLGMAYGYNASNTVYRPDTVVLPSTLKARFDSLQNSVASDVTVMRRLKDVFNSDNEFNIKNWIFDYSMNTASPSGGAAVLIMNSSSEFQEALLPVDFKPARAKQEPFFMEQTWWGLYGGISAYHPKSITLLTGI